jgi:hypothetical protein
MSGRNGGLEALFRWIGYFGTALVIVGVAVFAIGGLRAAYESGFSPVSVPITTDEMWLLLFGGGGGFLLGVLVNIFGRTVLGFLQGRREGTAGTTGNAPARASDASEPDRAPSEQYRRQLARSYKALAVLILAIATLASVGTAIPGRAGDVVGEIATIVALVLFGSVGAAVLTALLLGGLWYGIERGSAEALLAGAVVAVLFVLSTLEYGAFGLTIAGLWMVYYSVRARKSVSFTLLDPASVPEPVRNIVG